MVFNTKKFILLLITVKSRFLVFTMMSIECYQSKGGYSKNIFMADAKTVGTFQNDKLAFAVYFPHPSAYQCHLPE